MLTTEDKVRTIQAKLQVENDPNRPTTVKECWNEVGKLLGITGKVAWNRCQRMGFGKLVPRGGIKREIQDHQRPLWFSKKPNPNWRKPNQSSVASP